MADFELVSEEAEQVEVRIREAAEYAGGVQHEAQRILDWMEEREEEDANMVSVLDDILWDFRDVESELEDILIRVQDAVEALRSYT